MSGIRVLVCGGRDFNDRILLFKTLSGCHKYYGIDVIIEGEAQGADSLAKYWAESNKIKIEKYPANWSKHGKAAGPIRNKQMLDEGKPDLVIAFPGGKGTQNMITQAKQYNVKVIEVKS